MQFFHVSFSHMSGIHNFFLVFPLLRLNDASNLCNPLSANSYDFWCVSWNLVPLDYRLDRGKKLFFRGTNHCITGIKTYVVKKSL